MNIDTNGGAIVGMTIWTTGCARAIVQPPVSEEFAKGGKYPETFSCDVTMLRTTGEPNRLAPTLPARIDRSIGGPMPTPARR